MPSTSTRPAIMARIASCRSAASWSGRDAVARQAGVDLDVDARAGPDATGGLDDLGQRPAARDGQVDALAHARRRSTGSPGDHSHARMRPWSPVARSASASDGSATPSHSTPDRGGLLGRPVPCRARRRRPSPRPSRWHCRRGRGSGAGWRRWPTGRRPRLRASRLVAEAGGTDRRRDRVSDVGRRDRRVDRRRCVPRVRAATRPRRPPPRARPDRRRPSCPRAREHGADRRP